MRDNTITESGGASVDRGFIVWMDKHGYRCTYFDEPPSRQPMGAVLCLFAVIGMVLLVLLALANGWIR